MASKHEILPNLYEKYIINTPANAVVSIIRVLLCNLTNQVLQEIRLLEDCEQLEPKIYVNTRVLKHLYDRKPAEEFDFLVNNLHKVVKYPDHIYKNNDPKRGHYCFTKIIDGDNYLCSLEFKDSEIDLVTGFRLRKSSYLNNYDLLWSWGSGKSPS